MAATHSPVKATAAARPNYRLTPPPHRIGSDTSSAAT